MKNHYYGYGFLDTYIVHFEDIPESTRYFIVVESKKDLKRVIDKELEDEFTELIKVDTLEGEPLE